MPSLRIVRTLAALAGLLAVTACSGREALAPATPGANSVAHAAQARGGVRRTQTTPIEHVVFIVQENRSFDNLFQGYPGANTVPSGLLANGKTAKLVPIPLEVPYDVGHGFQSFVAAYDHGKMNGFTREGTTGDTAGYKFPEYGYVPQTEIGPYLQMAQQYTLNDNTFSSQLDASFSAHQYLIAGQAAASVNVPMGGPYWGCDGSGETIYTLTQTRKVGPTEAPCFDYTTLADEMNDAQPAITWAFYAPSVLTQSGGSIWSSFQAVKHIRYGTQWATNVKSPETTIITDVAAGTLANVTWVVPTVLNSDHSNSHSATGPNWVASVVDAIGNSQFWNTTAIFIIWDDWGGWYDHVPPPQLDYDGLGIRIPMLVVSPYSKQNYVSHVQYETASLLKFAEDNFTLAPMQASDTRAADPVTDTMDFSGTPRPFINITLRKGISSGLQPRAGPDLEPPDSE
jgi:phospholipase C